jgi:hypothetical protein
MVKKEIALLKEQIDRLDENNFDLEAWKNRTVIFLERIFGKENSIMKMIQKLHYDYSSWSLRDTFAGGSAREKDPVRIQAKEILEATIAELETLGIPGQNTEQQKVRELLEDDLTGKQIKELELLVNSDDGEKMEKLAKLLDTISKENLVELIAKLLTT